MWCSTDSSLGNHCHDGVSYKSYSCLNILHSSSTILATTRDSGGLQLEQRYSMSKLKCGHWYVLSMESPKPYAAFRLACRIAATSRDNRLLFHGLQLSAATLLWPITERHRSWVELKSTVCNLLRWAKRQGYRFIGKTLLAARLYLCGKWRLRSCTKITIKAAMRRAASQFESSITLVFKMVTM